MSMVPGRSKANVSVALAALLATTAAASIAGGAAHVWADVGHGTSDVGRPGAPGEVDRTVEVVLGDNYFEPRQISVEEGETIRFVLRNEGELLHEFNIGTAAMHADHQEDMLTMMQHGMITATGMGHMAMDGVHGTDQSMGMMTHDDPNSVLVEPGAVEELVWTFTNAMELEFACNIPGHYQSGMHGSFRFDH